MARPRTCRQARARSSAASRTSLPQRIAGRRRAAQPAARWRRRSASHAALQERRPPRAVMYVSCDPATLARDVSAAAGFRIASLRVLRHVSADRARRRPCASSFRRPHEIRRGRRRPNGRGRASMATASASTAMTSHARIDDSRRDADRHCSRLGDEVHRVAVAARREARAVRALARRTSIRRRGARRAHAGHPGAARSAAATDGPAPLIAPMPGLIVRVNVEPGDPVRPARASCDGSDEDGERVVRAGWRAGRSCSQGRGREGDGAGSKRRNQSSFELRARWRRPFARSDSDASWSRLTSPNCLSSLTCLPKIQGVYAAAGTRCVARGVHVRIRIHQ